MVTEEERKLVLARIENMPPHMKLSIGGQASLSKEKLIAKIKEGDPLGDKFVEIQLHYLRNLSKVYPSV